MGKRTSKWEERRADIQRMVNQDMTDDQIGVVYDVTRVTIYMARMRLGIASKPKAGSKRIRAVFAAQGPAPPPEALETYTDEHGRTITRCPRRYAEGAGSRPARRGRGVVSEAENGSDEAHAQLVKECLEELALMGFAAWENQRRAVQVNGRWVSLSKSGRGDIHVILPRRFDGHALRHPRRGRVQDRAEHPEHQAAGPHADGPEQRGRLPRGRATGRRCGRD